MFAPKLLYSIEQPHGLGELYFKWQKGESRFLLATTGSDATVAIHDRSGELVERIKLPGLCAGMEWDNDGDNLAMITPITNSVMLWECHTNKKESIETGLREAPSCLTWAHGEPLLAIGTTKGNLVLYNHHTTKRVPILGKHAKKITCGVWNKDGVLVLASEDKTLTISNSEGDTLRMISLRDTPNDLQVSEMKTDERSRGENTISLIVGKRTLFLYNLLNPENPIELAFQQRYGSIVSYKWYGDGYILIGFSAGYVIAISTHMKEVGEELFQAKNHKDSLTDVAVCGDLAATCGDGELKVMSLRSGEAEEAAGAARAVQGGGGERAGWSADGRLLCSAGRARLAVHVTAVPRLHAALGTRVLALTSLAEATLYECGGGGAGGAGGAGPARRLALPAEPALLALGAAHAVLAAGARGWMLPLGGGAVLQRHYAAPVAALRAAGDHVAVLFAGRAMLHKIEQPDGATAEHDGKMFPEPHLQGVTILDIQLTTDFFIFVTDRGDVEAWSVERLECVWRAAAGAGAGARVWADAGGARLALAGARGRLQVLDAGTQLRGEAPPAAAPRALLWDAAERGVLLAWGGAAFTTYCYSARGHTGAALHAGASTPARRGLEPALLLAGDLHCLDAGGALVRVALESHHTAGLAAADLEARRANQKTHIDKLLLLRRFSEAWLFCDAVDDADTWRKLGEAAMADLNIEFAIRVYTRLSDVAAVWALQDALHIEELPLLRGVMCAYLGEQEAAARWLQHAARGAQWALALHAAAARWQHAAAARPALQYRRAQHLHLAADYPAALAAYEAALLPAAPAHAAHNARCRAGVARCAVRCGEPARALAAAAQLGDAALLRECARALLDAGQLAPAAELFQRAGDAASAASAYIALGSWLKAEALLARVEAAGVHVQHARAREAAGRPREALRSYLRARDHDAAARLHLELGDVDAAVALVQRTKSVRAAKMVADHFQRGDDPSLAIEFLVMSLCYDEAFQLARKNGKLHLYGEILIETSQARPEDFRSLALHFEGEKNHLLSGKYFFHAGEHKKALSHLLKVGGTEEEESEAITIAIDAVAASDDDRLTRRLIEFLLGENDGTPRDPKHLFRLYMAKKQYSEAAKTAVVVGGAAARAGRYRAARDGARGAAGALRGAGAAVPRDLRRLLAAAHTYILVRRHVRRGRHELAAMLLLRTADDLSFFPDTQHRVSILTSTVIECARAGYKQEAYQWARVLMEPHYRSQIDDKYVKKIESVVRHGPPPPLSAAPPPPAPCPRCAAPLPPPALHCAACLADLPFCIATGLHIIKDELTACPECDFPAIYSEFVELLKEEGTCPMCNEAVDYQRLRLLDDVSPYLDTSQ